MLYLFARQRLRGNARSRPTSGDKVKEGQLLAEIETPEVDQEIAQARAQLARAQAGIAPGHGEQRNLRRHEPRSLHEISSRPASATQQELDEKGSSQSQVGRSQPLTSRGRWSAPRKRTLDDASPSPSRSRG